MTLAGHFTGCDEPQGVVRRRSFRARVEQHFGDLDDVVWQRAVPNGILRYKFQKSGIAKVVAAFENDALMDELRMLIEVGAQALRVTGIEKVHCAAKCGVFNSFVVR